MATLFTFGDSITQGAQATATSARYTNLLANSLGMTLDNSGVSTAMAIDQYSTLCSKTSYAGDVATVLFGTNDQAKYDSDPLKRQHFIDALNAYIIRMSCPVETVSTSNTTFTGSWSNGYALGAFGSYTVGNKATFNVTGSSIAIGTLRQYNNNGQFRVKIDGVLKGTFANGGDIRTILGSAWGPMCLIFTGLSNTSHTVEIEIAVGSSAADLTFFHWFAGLSGSKAKVLVGNIPKAIAYTYGGSLANVTTYNTAINDLINGLRSIGLPVQYVDINSALLPSDMADNVHPNNSGHSKIASTFFNVYNNTVVTPPVTTPTITYTPTTVYRASDDNFYVQDSSGTYKKLSAI